MGIKELRAQTGLSQGKFVNLFDILVATLKDWEQGRRKPPIYVVNMIKTILEYRGMIIGEDYIVACENRRKSVENALAIVLTATEGTNDEFLEALDMYIFGELSLEQLEENVNKLEYIGA